MFTIEEKRTISNSLEHIEHVNYETGLFTTRWWTSDSSKGETGRGFLILTSMNQKGSELILKFKLYWFLLSGDVQTKSETCHFPASHTLNWASGSKWQCPQAAI